VGGCLRVSTPLLVEPLMSATRRSRSPVKECFPSLFKALSNPRARLIAFRSSGPNPAASASSRRGSSCFWTLAVRRWASSRGRGSRRPRVWGPWEALGSWSFSRPCRYRYFKSQCCGGAGIQLWVRELCEQYCLWLNGSQRRTVGSWRCYPQAVSPVLHHRLQQREQSVGAVQAHVV
jgi:hypothetical protein